jgi:hypothetical protein
MHVKAWSCVKMMALISRDLGLRMTATGPTTLTPGAVCFEAMENLHIDTSPGGAVRVTQLTLWNSDWCACIADISTSACHKQGCNVTGRCVVMLWFVKAGSCQQVYICAILF